MSALDNKTILVTGASGFIGSYLVERLSKLKGSHLLLLSRHARSSTLPNVQWIQGDLSDLTPSYWQRLGISDIDIVFHLGAFTPKAGSDANNIEKVFTDNLLGTRTLLEGLPSGVSHIIFSSTLDVYAPGIEGEVITEDSCVNPSGLYGASKLFCEQLVSVWAEEHHCQYSILRFGHIFGPGEEAYSKLIPLVIQDLLAGKTPNVYGSGIAERDFLYVTDAVEATIRAVTMDGSNAGPVNIVRGESSPIRKIVEILIEETNVDVGINFLRDKPDGYSLRFSNLKMRKELGDWSLVSLADGLEKEVYAFRRLLNDQ